MVLYTSIILIVAMFGYYASICKLKTQFSSFNQTRSCNILTTIPYFHFNYSVFPSCLPIRARTIRAARRRITPNHLSERPLLCAFFIFIFFIFVFTKIYFQYYNLQFCTPTALLGGGRGPAAPQEGGRDLFVNKKIICADALGASLPPPCRAAGPLPPLHWAAGGRQAP